MRLTEEQLRNAAVKARDKELAALPAELYCPDYEVSEQFEQTVKQILMQLEQGTLKPDAVRMGWQYYTKRSAAVILLCTGLACAAMPETVMAACQRIIETVEKVFEEYTEFRFGSITSADAKFVPIQMAELPSGTQVHSYEISDNSVFIDCSDETGRIVLVVQQQFITENDNPGYIADTEDAEQEQIEIQGDSITLISKKERLHFIWVHDSYLLTGQTRLQKEELINILKHIKF